MAIPGLPRRWETYRSCRKMELQPFFPNDCHAGNRAPDLVLRGRQGQARGLVDFGNRGREHVAVQIGKSFDLALRQPKYNLGVMYADGEGVLQDDQCHCSHVV